MVRFPRLLHVQHCRLLTSYLIVQQHVKDVLWTQLPGVLPPLVRHRHCQRIRLIIAPVARLFPHCDDPAIAAQGAEVIPVKRPQPSDMRLILMGVASVPLVGLAAKCPPFPATAQSMCSPFICSPRLRPRTVFRHNLRSRHCQFLLSAF